MQSQSTATTIGLAHGVRPLKRAEYDQLIEAGAFTDERLELIRGVIVTMSPTYPPHAATIRRLTELFPQRLSGRAHLGAHAWARAHRLLRSATLARPTTGAALPRSIPQGHRCPPAARALVPSAAAARSASVMPRSFVSRRDH